MQSSDPGKFSKFEFSQGGNPVHYARGANFCAKPQEKTILRPWQISKIEIGAGLQTGAVRLGGKFLHKIERKNNPQTLANFQI